MTFGNDAEQFNDSFWYVCTRLITLRQTFHRSDNGQFQGQQTPTWGHRMWRSFPGHGDWWTCCHPVGFPWWSCSAWDDIYRWGRPLSNCWHGWLWPSSLTAPNTASTEERGRNRVRVTHYCSLSTASYVTWLYHNQQLIHHCYTLIDWLINNWLIDWIVFYAVLAIFQPYKGGLLYIYHRVFLIITNWFLKMYGIQNIFGFVFAVLSE